jgi:hypothetical protein
VLNAKGGEIKAKAKWISQPLVNFENRVILKIEELELGFVKILLL